MRMSDVVMDQRSSIGRDLWSKSAWRGFYASTTILQGYITSLCYDWHGVSRKGAVVNDQQRMLPWTQPGWRDTVETWVRAQLAQQEIVLTGDITEVQQRAWSTVLRVPTDVGALYFKAAAPVLRHEPALLAALTAWHPATLPGVVAVDPGQGWLLMRDGGVTLRSLVQSVDDFDHWHAILPAYAALQRAMIARAGDLLALGALDRRLSTLPEQVARLLDDTGALMIDQPDGLTAAQVQQMRDLVPEYTAMCAQLAAYGIPETLHHEDFHDANIFVQDSAGETRYTFADWGESGVAHPFFTLLVTLRSIAYRLKLEFGGPEVLALRDVYLAAWAAYGTMDDLRAAADLAARVAMPARALTWNRVVSTLPESERAEDAGAVPGWLQVFLEAQAVGSRSVQQDL
jgi:hypothetical protein